MTPKLTTFRLILREIKGNDLFGYNEIVSDTETMKLFGGRILNELDNRDFIERMKIERGKGISYFWTITLKEEKEFIGFVRLMSYNSIYYDASFEALGEHKFDDEILKYFDRKNAWEIDYALLKNQRNKGIMAEAVEAVMKFCQMEQISVIFAKVKSLKNEATIRVLENNNFHACLPQIDNKIFKNYDVKEMIEKKECGMIYKCTP